MSKLKKLKDLIKNFETRLSQLEKGASAAQQLPPVLTHNQIMELEKISFSTFIRRIKSEMLIATKRGGKYILKREDYLKYLNNK